MWCFVVYFLFFFFCLDFSQVLNVCLAEKDLQQEKILFYLMLRELYIVKLRQFMKIFNEDSFALTCSVYGCGDTRSINMAYAALTSFIWPELVGFHVPSLKHLPDVLERDDVKKATSAIVEASYTAIITDDTTKRNIKVICFSGCPGVGKTTATAHCIDEKSNLLEGYTNVSLTIDTSNGARRHFTMGTPMGTRIGFAILEAVGNRFDKTPEGEKAQRRLSRTKTQDAELVCVINTLKEKLSSTRRYQGKKLLLNCHFDEIQNLLTGKTTDQCTLHLRQMIESFGTAMKQCTETDKFFVQFFISGTLYGHLLNAAQSTDYGVHLFSVRALTVDGSFEAVMKYLKRKYKGNKKNLKSVESMKYELKKFISFVGGIPRDIDELLTTIKKNTQNYSKPFKCMDWEQLMTKSVILYEKFLKLDTQGELDALKYCVAKVINNEPIEISKIRQIATAIDSMQQMAIFSLNNIEPNKLKVKPKMSQAGICAAYHAVAHVGDSDLSQSLLRLLSHRELKWQDWEFITPAIDVLRHNSNSGVIPLSTLYSGATIHSKNDEKLYVDVRDPIKLACLRSRFPFANRDSHAKFPKLIYDDGWALECDAKKLFPVYDEKQKNEMESSIVNNMWGYMFVNGDKAPFFDAFKFIFGELDDDEDDDEQKLIIIGHCNKFENQDFVLADRIEELEKVKRAVDKLSFELDEELLLVFVIAAKGRIVATPQQISELGVFNGLCHTLVFISRDEVDTFFKELAPLVKNFFS